jgi:hypothetical protein
MVVNIGKKVHAAKVEGRSVVLGHTVEKSFEIYDFYTNRPSLQASGGLWKGMSYNTI